LLLLGGKDLSLKASGSWFFFLSQSGVGWFVSWLSWWNNSLTGCWADFVNSNGFGGWSWLFWWNNILCLGFSSLALSLGSSKLFLFGVFLSLLIGVSLIKSWLFVGLVLELYLLFSFFLGFGCSDDILWLNW
jgi:hypothetical protein